MQDKDIYAEISSIKTMMERSTKFISLSGLSGVIAGIYALIGAALAYQILYSHTATYGYHNVNEEGVTRLFLIALAVLVLSLSTGLWLTIRKAHGKGHRVWNQTSKQLLTSGALPLLTGGCFVLLLLMQGYYLLLAPVCLIFYGLALVSASKYTFGDVKWLGLCEVGLGLLAALLPHYGLAFWATGFGLLHILYGTIMHFKYDRENSAH